MIMTKKRMKHFAIILAILTAIFFLNGCGSKIPSPTETTDAFLQALKAQDDEAIAGVYADEELDLLDAASDSEEEAEDTEGSEDLNSGLESVYEEQLLPKMLDFDYEISNEQINGDKATVDVKFTTYKIGEAFTAFFGDYISQAFVLAFSDVSEEELDALAATTLSSKLADLTEKSYEKTVTIPLTMTDGKWVVDQIESESDIIDAITGGLVTSMKNMDEAFSAWDEEE